MVEQQDSVGLLSSLSPLHTIGDKEFALFQELICRQSGIYLSTAKRALLVGRLVKRLQELAISSFHHYYQLVLADRDEMIKMLDAICTNETHFFREGQHFEFIEDVVIAEWRRQEAAGRRERRIRVWSAGCSSGEEPYSLAMLLLWHFPPGSGWQIEILATDLSTRALAKAVTAVWPLERAAEIPPRFLKEYMLKGVRSQAGKMRASATLREAVDFQRVNLNDEVYAVNGCFDLIFCRNVLIYFHQRSKAQVIDKLFHRLAATGYLFLGHAESLTNLTDQAECIIPNVYKKIAPPGEHNSALTSR